MTKYCLLAITGGAFVGKSTQSLNGSQSEREQTGRIQPTRRKKEEAYTRGTSSSGIAHGFRGVAPHVPGTGDPSFPSLLCL